MDRCLVFAFFWFFFAVDAEVKSGSLRICVVGNIKTPFSRTLKYCDLLGKSKRSPVSCVCKTDRLECLLAVSRREADFGIFEAEDLYFSTQWEESSILVTSEIRGLKDNPYEYGVVVLVRKDSNVTSLADLRGKSLCHPGVESGPSWDLLFAQYFEERVASAGCEQNLSIYEDRIKTSSNFFSSACKTGPWVYDSEEDLRLKKKYWNMCSLCASGFCDNTEKYRGSGGSITCFRDGVGDVLWARHEDIKVHLKFLESDSDDYSYLCDDGSLMSFSSQEPCIWLAKPWQIVGAHRKSATGVQKILDALHDGKDDDWKENLLHVIELYLKYIENLAVSRTPEDYLRRIPGYLSASAMSEGNCNPRHSIKLCVSSILEQQKCIWLSKAASSLAIQPALECVQKKNRTMCLDSVAKQETDVVVVPADYVFDAVVKFNLENFLVEAGNHLNDSYLVSGIVKTNLKFKSFEDLKGKKVCFTRKGGIGWQSVLTVLYSKSYLRSRCRDPGNMSEFFDEICFASGSGNDPLCCPNMDIPGTDDENVLFCLHKDGCDIAFMDINTLKQSTDEKNAKSWAKALKFSDFEQIFWTDKSKDNHWMWSHQSYLMINSKVNFVKRTEIQNVFFLLNKYFGKKTNKKNTMMEMFGNFYGVRNVLFKDNSVALLPSNPANNSDKFFETVKSCLNSSFTCSPHLYLLVMLLLLSCFNSEF